MEGLHCEAEQALCICAFVHLCISIARLVKLGGLPMLAKDGVRSMRKSKGIAYCYLFFQWTDVINKNVSRN